MGADKELDQFTEEELKELASQLSHPQGEWGEKVAEIMTETNMSMIHDTIDVLKITYGDKVLELGPGEGKHLSYFFKNYPDTKYTALEISELMVQKFRGNNGQYLQKQWADIQIYNGENIPYSEPLFNTIFTVNTLYFWKNPKELLYQICEILKEGGQCFITFSNKDFMDKLPFTQYGFTKYTQDDLEQLVAQTPFQWTDFLTRKELINTTTNEFKERIYHIAVLTKTDGKG